MGAEEERASIVSTATNVVALLAGVIGLAGYVLALGGAILFVRLNNADLPAELPVALASRNELLVLGGQALAMWLLLALALGASTARLARRGRERGSASILVCAAGVAIALAASHDEPWRRSTLIALGAVMAVALAGSYAYGGRDGVVDLAVPVGTAALVGLAFPWFTDNAGAITYVGVALVFLLVLLLVPYIQERRRASDAADSAVRQLLAVHAAQTVDRPPYPAREQTAVALLTALGRDPDDPRRVPPPSPWAALRLLALVASVLLLLGGVAVATQFDEEGSFHTASVTMRGGRCVTGTFVARTDDALVLAGRGDRKRAVVLPKEDVLDVTLWSPRATAVDVTDGRCADVSASPRPAPQEEEGGKSVRD